MTINGDRDMQCLTEVVQNDRRSSGIGAAVAGTHASGFIQQKAHRHLRDLVRQGVFIEHFAIVPAESMGIQPASHHESSLLTAALLILQLL